MRRARIAARFFKLALEVLSSYGQAFRSEYVFSLLGTYGVVTVQVIQLIRTLGQIFSPARKMTEN